MFRDALGLGEIARLYLRGLEAAQVPVTTRTVTVEDLLGLRSPLRHPKVPFVEIDCGRRPRAELLCVNGGELDALLASTPEPIVRPAIGIWGWETDAVPDTWVTAAVALDEVWTYSRHAAANLSQSLPVPVVVVPPPVVTPDSGDARLEIGLPDGFTFLFMFDFGSRVARKNPEGLVRAFMAAFEPDEGPHLVLKTINSSHDPGHARAIEWLVRERPDIHVIDCELEPHERAALLARCDCYVSLHRAEGFGLPLAEAMALGKPVIATGYSGNTDFMTPANSYLVEYSLVAVADGDPIYPAGGTWAEPDLRHAAALMRAVFSDPTGARERGALARTDLARQHGPAVAGAVARRRLERVITWSGRP